MVEYNLLFWILIFILVCLFFYHWIIAHLKSKKKRIEKENLVVLQKIMKIVFVVVVFVGLMGIVAFNFDNLWASLTGIIAIIGIAFFAVWSLLSNVVAGLILLISKPFKLKDEIIILPENISGVVKKIGVIFIVLSDSEENEIKIPNNLVFQRIIKNKGKIK